MDSKGVMGHRDHVAATAAIISAAASLHIPVLGWTLPVDVAERFSTAGPQPRRPADCLKQPTPSRLR